MYYAFHYDICPLPSIKGGVAEYLRRIMTISRIKDSTNSHIPLPYKMTSAIRTKAYSLPELLLTLPRDGIGALVRPSSSPNSVYRVTRSKLKFRARSENGESSAASSTAGKDELLAVSGKIWGMRFDNGMRPTSQKE